MSATHKIKGFTASNDIIRHFIFSQAGTIDKAIAELVMNEVDAKATRIDISVVNENKLIVSGNGVGFQSEEEIDELFSVFGFDHTTEKELSRDRDFGKFGLGRAQIFAFGRSEWLSNRCEMIVDFKDQNISQDLPYLFKMHDQNQHAGCKISIDLYKPLCGYEYVSLERTLRHMLKFVKTEIYFNDTLLNTPHQTMKWKAKSEHLVFQPSDSTSAGLSVYNKGVFVRTYSYSVFGVSGTACSVTETFQLNVARNDIMVASCPLYEEMKELIKPFANRERKKVKLSFHEQQSLLTQFLQGDVALDDFMKMKLFVAAKGSDRSLGNILSEFGGRICIVRNTDRIYTAQRESMQRDGGTMVIMADALEPLRLQCPVTNMLFCESVVSRPYTKEEWANLTAQLHKALGDGVRLSTKHARVDWYRSDEYIAREQEALKKLTLEDPHSVLKRVAQIAKFSMRDPSKYSPTQKIQAKVVAEFQTRIAKACAGYFQKSGQSELSKTMTRNVRIGESTIAAAWTDSRSYIAYNHDYLSRCMDSGTEGMYRLALTIVHELMHTTDGEDDPDAQSHSFEFYRNYEEALKYVFEYGLHHWITLAVRQYWKAREKAGLSNAKLAKKESDLPVEEHVEAA